MLLLQPHYAFLNGEKVVASLYTHRAAAGVVRHSLCDTDWLLNDNVYFKFHKDFVTFTADTVGGGLQVDVTMNLHKYRTSWKDDAAPHTRYMVKSVNFHNAAGEGKLPLHDNSITMI